MTSIWMVGLTHRTSCPHRTRWFSGVRTADKWPALLGNSARCPDSRRPRRRPTPNPSRPARSKSQHRSFDSVGLISLVVLELTRVQWRHYGAKGWRACSHGRWNRRAPSDPDSHWSLWPWSWKWRHCATIRTRGEWGRRIGATMTRRPFIHLSFFLSTTIQLVLLTHPWLKTTQVLFVFIARLLNPSESNNNRMVF